MCGIYAQIVKGNICTKELLSNFSVIVHRGPDHTSYYIDTADSKYTIILGFHRLSIVGTLPITDNLLLDNEVYLVCNGEIYNYKQLITKYSLNVKTDSDCEVILQMYLKGLSLNQMLQDLDGVFAFVLYDKPAGIVLAGRDTFGVRPLFKEQSEYHWGFASEAKALAHSSVTPVKPGTAFQISLKVMTDIDVPYIINKWTKNPIQNNRISQKVVDQIVKTLFIDAVEKRLISDRPIGFLLSGGLDSSLVATVASHILNKPITTFSIGLEGSPDLKAAQQVASYLGSNHHSIVITEEDILSVLDDVIYHTESYDITTIRASIPMYLISKYIKTNTDIKVIFSGEGADELLGGYLYFHQAPNDEEFHSETERLLEELYLYDLLRGDRTTAAFGLELRVPFLDVEFTKFIRSLPACFKSPHYHNNVEKMLMRRVFDGWLPESIIKRQKEAFSDGIGYNSVALLKKYASEQNIENVSSDWGVKPTTMEAKLYYSIFVKYFGVKPNIHTQKYWMPKWNPETNDPSATTLQTHCSKL